MPWKKESIADQRWRFVQEWLRNKRGVAGQCRRWRVSRKTAHKWLLRFRARGRLGLADQRRGPRQPHNRPAQKWLGRIRRLRLRKPTWGAPKLRWTLQRRYGRAAVPSEAAISRWLKRWDLSRKRARPTHKGPLADRPALTRPKRANEVWTVDFKGWFRTGDGRRVDPLTIRDLYSRYALGIILLRGQGIDESRRAFVKVFRKYGLPQAIRADNGAPFGATGTLGLTRLSAWWVRLGIRVEFIEPAHPEQNGAHEQFHRVYKDELLKPASANVRAQRRRTFFWLRDYNHHRPHEGLRMRVPADHYRKSRRKMPVRLRPLRYPKSWRARRVKFNGMIGLKGQERYIGEAFAGQKVGLKVSQSGSLQVYFGKLLLGELVEKGTTGIRAVWYRQLDQRSPIRQRAASRLR